MMKRNSFYDMIHGKSRLNVFVATVEAIVLLLSPSFRGNAQSRNFKLTQGLEIQYNILRTLATEYVDTVDFAKLINYGIDAMLQSIDPYTEFVPEENSETIEMMTTASYGGIGATIRKDSLGVMIMQTYEGSPAIRYNIEPGDIILKIDGTPCNTLTVDECSKRMRGNPGTRVTFLIKKGRTGKNEEIVVTRDKVHTSDVPYFGLLQAPDTLKICPTGYIKLSSFTLNGSEDVRKALISLKDQGAQRIILDLRGNGGGLMDEATDIVSLFVPKGTLVATARGRGEGANFSCVTDKAPVDTLIPLMVLVSSSSASSSEIVAGALQDLDRALIVGTRTYGKGLVQSFRPVGYNGKLKLTIAKYYTPSGRCIQILDYAHRNPDGSVGSVPDSLKKAFQTKHGRTVYDGGGITPDIEIKPETYSRPALALSLSGILEEYAVDFYTRNPDVPALKSKIPSSSTSTTAGTSDSTTTTTAGTSDSTTSTTAGTSDSTTSTTASSSTPSLTSTTASSSTPSSTSTASSLESFTAGSFKMTDAQWEDFVKYAATKKFDHRSASEIVFEQLVREAKEEGLYEQNKEAYDLLESKVKLTKEEAINQNREEIQPLVEEDIIQKYQLTAPRIRHMLDYDSQLWKAVSSWR
ncbi:MAG: S41 family peptidase [Bacteroidales bacterium]|jgi:carboxyl-terminal processing protease|nr:S41 family peptidase [Bacteroidales bacterium]